MAIFAIVGRRLGQSLLSLLFLVTAVFFIARMTGDPGQLYLPLDATPEAVAQFDKAHGFDQPAYRQFERYAAGIVHLDFGQSLRREAPALDVVFEAFPTTVVLVVATELVALVFSVVAGSLMALRPGSLLDRAGTVLVVAGASLPDFWVALMAILVFSVSLHVLPTSGPGGILHWIMPVGVLSLRAVGSLTQVVRGSTMEILASPYIEAARGRGVGNIRILFFHSLRNAAIPVITLVGIQVAGILNGTVIVETIFGLPGIGRLLVTSILGRDFAVVEATVIVVALTIFAVNIVIDLSYSAIDPRVRA